MKKYTLVNFESIRTAIASVHKAGCKAIKNDIREHGGYTMNIEAESGEAVAAIYIDGELQELGYAVHDVKVHNCAS